VSGEIHVQKLLAPARPSQPYPAETPRVQVREDSGKAYVRKSTATPPGSARALDEPPPIAVGHADPSRKTDSGRKSEASAHAPAKPVASRIIKVDDGRDDDKFSKSEAEQELGVSSRGRKVIGVVAGAFAAVMAVVVYVAIKRNTPKAALQDGRAATAEASPAITPAQPVPPAITPLAETPSSPGGPRATSVDTMVVGARKTTPAQAAAAVGRDDLDERTADPRMSRERASEARPLLSVCRMAFEEKRMRDAEAACVAARDANPDSADAHALLAHALFNRNKRREALTSAERAVKLNPKLADAYVIIGGVLQEDGDVEEARRAYQHYLDLEPKGSYAADLRAIISRLPAKL
jgi:hypothetical protein